ncbi:MAG: NADH-quinone oxidoreductase subunit C [Gammaproteobacteria bacterium]|nr:NADH-quinone oxidoreductase subunit C [Gammaproteobacteria bacterium]MBU1776870.1 NADH-quinone oxidoreductase subunit C [Gammaproteobacteria bacterium]MBU1967670.1 NADH-quinone oxidoreductase subunit C [Gammaproteobacteria bacterium]
MATDLNILSSNINEAFSGKVVSLEERLGELTLVVGARDMIPVFTRLRDDADLRFEELIDVCGIDYSSWGSETCEDGKYLADVEHEGPRFAAVYHLLSVTHNLRLRVRVFAEDDSLPMLDSVTDIWPSANWFEREAFDLYGIIFVGHPDLRRILTDYGFIGNPFRKDFPLSGTVEMRYDAAQRRVVYEPVTVEPREVTPRTLREENYGRS